MHDMFYNDLVCVDVLQEESRRVIRCCKKRESDLIGEGMEQELIGN